MKTLTLLLISFFTFSLTAQNEATTVSTTDNSATPSNKSQINNFEANVDLSKDAIQLKWQNAAKSNSKEFIIEKSSDRTTWETVAIVFGAAHKSQETEFFHVDFQPLDNLSYYRLTAKNKDGKTSTSNIVPVNYIKKEGATAGMNLHPDFSEDYKIINIAFEEVFDKEILVVIRDKDGNEFYSKVIINIDDKTLVAVPIENEIPKGDYLVTATSENQIYSQNLTIY